MTRPQRDDAIPFQSRWLRGEKRYLLCLGFPLEKPPVARLPDGVEWDLWYERPYLLLQGAVYSSVVKWGVWPSHKDPRPGLECLTPVRSADGKPGWYRFWTSTAGLGYRVQFFPEGKSSRSEIEFVGPGPGGKFSLRAETHGGAEALTASPEAAYCFSRGYFLDPVRNGVRLSAFEHQNRMAWEASDLSVELPPAWKPEGVSLAADSPELRYFAKGSEFAASRPRAIGTH